MTDPLLFTFNYYLQKVNEIEIHNPSVQDDAKLSAYEKMQIAFQLTEMSVKYRRTDLRHIVNVIKCYNESA
jgi:hypothetical protein